MPFYEEPRQGSGLHAYYFNNAMFEGDPEKTLIENINFRWFGQKPSTGTNAFSFSVIYEGKLTVPITDAYTFILNSDSAVELKINGDILIDHFMNDRHKGVKGKRLGGEVRSSPYHLDSGRFYTLSVRYWTSIEQKFDPWGLRFI